MSATVNIDKAGRIVLPKALRDNLHLVPGDTVELTMEDERVMLRPQRVVSPLQKERGVWVLRTGEPLTTAQARDALHGIRERRIRRNLDLAGKSG
jgi:AbrB family looped-hinge helix DNA binding protein